MSVQETGAGEGNRTLVVSLGSFCSTIELHPRSMCELYGVYNHNVDVRKTLARFPDCPL